MIVSAERRPYNTSALAPVDGLHGLVESFAPNDHDAEPGRLPSSLAWQVRGRIRNHQDAVDDHVLHCSPQLGLYLRRDACNLVDLVAVGWARRALSDEDLRRLQRCDEIRR